MSHVLPSDERLGAKWWVMPQGSVFIEEDVEPHNPLVWLASQEGWLDQVGKSGWGDLLHFQFLTEVGPQSRCPVLRDRLGKPPCLTHPQQLPKLVMRQQVTQRSTAGQLRSCRRNEPAILARQ